MRLLLAICACLLALPGAATAGAGSSKLRVVAAENVWGSIASQLGGDRTDVGSIVTDPETDPHSYEPTPSDARTLAGAKIAIVNGIGYDPWARQLLDADGGGRTVIDIGDVLGLGNGDNPHQWYSPSSVRRVAAAITAAYIQADPGGARYFKAQNRSFLIRGLARYNFLRAEIRRRFAGVPVGYSESIFAPLAASLGLRLLTPSGFPKAIAEGSEVSVSDKEAVARQLRGHLVKVWVYNSQNVTPEVEQANELARAEHVPIATVTETLAPATLDFEQWQDAELQGLIAALHRATGR